MGFHSTEAGFRNLVQKLCVFTLDSGIDIGQGINVGPGKLGKKNKRMAFNKYLHIHKKVLSPSLIRQYGLEKKITSIGFKAM